MVGRDRRELEESWAIVAKEKNKKGSGRRPLTPKTKTESPSACTIMMTNKYILAPILPIIELISLMEISIEHTDAAINLIQCHDPFLEPAMVCSLLADALKNEIVGPIDKEAIN